MLLICYYLCKNNLYPKCCPAFFGNNTNHYIVFSSTSALPVSLEKSLSNNSPNVSTTPIMAMGCRQCLSLTVVHLKGKHCRKPHCRNGVVGTFEHSWVPNKRVYSISTFRFFPTLLALFLPYLISKFFILLVY